MTAARFAGARLLVAGALFLLALPAAPTAVAGALREIETADLRLLYPGGTLGYLAPHTVRCFENAMRMHRRLFEYAPTERVTVVLVDNSDFSNAGVSGTPRNTMIVQVAPSNTIYETGPSNERINFLMNHELTHVVTLDQATGSDLVFRRLFFGKVRESGEHPETVLYNFLTVPRRAAPRWHREGEAVFLETWMSGGLGRAQGPYDEMVFRAMVRDSTHFYDPLGLEASGTKVDFQVGANSYLYGARFSTWLADRYGPAAMLDWAARRPGSRAYFANQFSHVFHRPLREAWRDWVAGETAFQRANLDSVRRWPTTQSRDLSSQPLGSVSQPVYDPVTRTVYAGVFHPGAVAHIAAIPLSGTGPRFVHEVDGPTLYSVCSIAWDPVRRRIFYTKDNNDWRDLCELDPATGKVRTLIRDARIGDLSYDRADSSLWAVRHFNGISTVVRLKPPYDDWNQMCSFPYGRDVFDIAVSPDGTTLAASVSEVSGRQTLRLFPVESIARGDTSSRTLHDFGTSSPNSFVYSADGRFLYGSSYYTGVSNIFRWDLAADSLDLVTNAETGFFRPLPLGGDSLMAFRFAGGGFVPALLEAPPLHDASAITFFGQQVIQRHPELQSWKVPPPSSVVIESLVTYDGDYRALRSVRLVSLYPVVESYRDRAAVGLQAVLSDPVAIHELTATGSVTREGPGGGQRVHGTLDYRHGATTLRLMHDPAAFYDLFGPTKTSRKGDGAQIEWSRTLVNDQPRTLELGANAGGWTGLERLPDAQNVSTSPGFDKLVSMGAGLKDKKYRSSIGSVEAEKGWQWTFDVSNNAVRFVRGGVGSWRSFPSFEGSADAGVPLPMRNSSTWLRLAAGYAPGDRNEPFANFFFGGFGNNWVDRSDPKRYRRPGAFPGVEIDAVAGTNYGRAMWEVNLPPLHIERLGTPALYASWLRTSVFTTALSTNADSDADRRTLGNIGVQCDVRFSVLNQQPFTLSGGYARAFERRGAKTHEWMISLKVL
jgi:hypothetical protein